jgi:hypothetical protein
LKAGRCGADYLCSLCLPLAAEEAIEESYSLGHVSALKLLKVLDSEAVLVNHLLMSTGIRFDCDTHLADFVVVGLKCVILNAYW